MARTAKQIVISGYYGFRNSGDEAVLQSILLALKEEGDRAGIAIEPVVLSIDPELTGRMYGVRSVHRMKPGALWSALRSADGLISGGGSLLQDATSGKTIPYYAGIIKLAQWLGKPVFIYSQGIGPVNRKPFFSLIKHAFDRCKYVSVRDQESADLLAVMGYTKSVEVVPDPVMGLPLREQDAAAGSRAASDGGKPVVGVSVRFWKEDRSELAAIAQTLDRIRASRDVEIRFLPFHLPADEQASQEVIERMEGADRHSSVHIVKGTEHPQDMLREVSGCDLLIGMRLHSLIYAASQYVPMIGVSYDPKIDQFLNRLELAASASVDHYDAAFVAAEAIRLLDGKEAWVASKRSLIDRLKQEAHQPAKQIAAYFRQEG